MRKSAFTLVELLVVVAIMAVLALIAVPNFLEAQIRSKVSRVKNDLRTLATGLESYTVDNNTIPYDGEAGNHWGWQTALKPLSTPVAYLGSLPVETFFSPEISDSWAPAGTTYFHDPGTARKLSYDYGTAYYHGVDSDTAAAENWNRSFGGSRWKIGSAGPDGRYTDAVNPAVGYGFGSAYDPTNGTVSAGDIYRSQARIP